MRLLREYIKQVIKESAEDSTSYLGAVVFDEKSHKCAVIYDTRMIGRVPKLLMRMEKDWNGTRASLCDNVIRGFIEVGPWHGGESKCNNAWMVYRAAGPGLGKLVYSIGYALSPSGRLMPDRESVSPDAEAAWTSVSKKSQYKQLPLDDEDAHFADGTARYDHPNHTDDPGDDCTVHDEKPFLNYAYEGTGEEQSLLSILQDNSTSALEELFPGRAEEVEGLLKSSGGLYFSMNYAI